jgi:uncharacterized protein YndB with AHSA1/START domain
MTELATVAPITKTVLVRCDVETAFRVFTAEIGAWWPTDTHSIAEHDVRELVFEQHEGGELYEVSADGVRSHWARIQVWEPPNRLVLDWHVNPAAAAPTEIEVTFGAEGLATVVHLEHRHWERLGATGRERRDGYESGWEPVLARFAEAVAT